MKTDFPKTYYTLDGIPVVVEPNESNTFDRAKPESGFVVGYYLCTGEIPTQQVHNGLAYIDYTFEVGKYHPIWYCLTQRPEVLEAFKDGRLVYSPEFSKDTMNYYASDEESQVL